MISTLMTKKLAIKFKSEDETVSVSNTQSFYKLREKKKTVKLRKENPEKVKLFTNEPEYLKYESKELSPDLGNMMTIQRYIGQNMMRSRRQNRLVSRLAKF